MTFAILFWILMLFWLVLDLWSGWPFASPTRPFGSVLLFVIIALIGWHVFGPIVSR